MVLVNKVLEKFKYSKNFNNEKHAKRIIFFNEKKIGKIGIIFDVENRLWKSEIGTFRSLDLECTYIDPPKKLWRWNSTIYHSIKLPVDVEVAEKFLNGIYANIVVGWVQKSPTICWRNKGMVT